MTAEEYLRDKLQSIDSYCTKFPDSKKAINKGAQLLVESGVWRTRLGDWVAAATDSLMMTHKVNSKAGKRTKLTQASVKVGAPIAYEIALDDENYWVTLPIGDLFIEALMAEGLLTLERESKQRDAPWLILIEKPTYRKTVLKGTFSEEPPSISGLKSAVGPFIKNWKSADADKFKQLVEENPPFMQALNKLRKTAWQLDTQVLEVVKANPDFFMSETIDLIETATGEIHTFPLDHDFKKFLKTKWSHIKGGGQFLGPKDVILLKKRSQRYDYKAVMGKAELIYDQTFWQEYTCDYRGRIYCGESYLQFQGSDIARGMFVFAEKKAYTPAGVRRLKIHLANSYNGSFNRGEMPSYFVGQYDERLKADGLETISMDKLMLDDRVRWVDANIDILRNVRTLDDKAEAPVAYLAACMELDRVLADPGYKGGLPIPVDGSNNGWQHLSAMSKDADAAELVSMTDAEYQKDFYVAVAQEMVKNYPEWFKKKKIPMKHIRKGIAKRGAMTRAYSAGKDKIAINMMNDCKTMGLVSDYKITQKDTDVLAGHLIEAVNTVCRGPLRLTKWLQAIANHEVKSGAKHFEWETPSGFPVKYEMYICGTQSVRSSITQVGEIRHRLRDTKTKKERIAGELSDVGPTMAWFDTGELIADAKAYASGIAPNVVHSYDAAHMAFVISRFEGCFGAVHDSFSSHASDIEDLLTITKGAFIAMYEMPSWFDDFKSKIMQHSDTFTVANPDLGTYDVSSVINAEYFFC